MLKSILKHFAKSTKKICAGVSFNQVAGLRSSTLLKSESNTDFPVNFAKFLTALILHKISKRLLLCVLQNCYNIRQITFKFTMKNYVNKAGQFIDALIIT